MNRIDARFELLAAQGDTAFIPYITAGDPTLAMTHKIVLELERAGCDIVELGVPFSDPIADGVVNQEAAQRALKHNVTLHDVVNLVREIRKTSEISIVLFTYYNPILAYGVDTFAKDCASAGVDGVLCVDLPPGEDADYKRALDANGIATIFLAAPTSPPDRIALIAKSSTGFVYYVSRTGVTGERADIATTVQGMVASIKQHTSTPVAVGFGISSPAQAMEVAGYADGVIVGSAIVRLIGKSGESLDTPKMIYEFVKPLVDATKSGATTAKV
ncbi:MAG: tryptophan synthase subunit alpha [Candidatus Hydrogenedentes bacterium]|nr:tryptophan synthase subunit alpha [Candidatus Hydrogenedentota bacterium]